MAINVKQSKGSQTTEFEGMIVYISREAKGGVNSPFCVGVNSGTELMGPAKDYVLTRYFEDPDALPIINQINSCLEIMPGDSDEFDGLEDWYTPPAP